MNEVVVFVLYSIIMLLLIRLSWTDIRTRIISNKIVLWLLFFILPLSWLKYGQIFIIPSIIALIIGFIVFSLKAIGAGDVKLITVLLLSIPNNQILSFFLFTTLYGLLLIIIGWFFFRKSIKTNGLPYGVAISLGFLTNSVLFW